MNFETKMKWTHFMEMSTGMEEAYRALAGVAQLLGHHSTKGRVGRQFDLLVRARACIAGSISGRGTC